MAQITREQAIDYLSTLSSTELDEIIRELEHRWSLTADQVTVAGAPGAVAEKTAFDVVLVKTGAKKIDVIKAIRQLTGLGLREAKDAAESAPTTILQRVERQEAEQAKAVLEAAGASATIK
ncbi:MAG: 50S ribosomal protein L7/L12 [Pseudomonadota bacterium]